LSHGLSSVTGRVSDTVQTFSGREQYVCQQHNFWHKEGDQRIVEWRNIIRLAVKKILKVVCNDSIRAATVPNLRMKTHSALYEGSFIQKISAST
jgi:hypothetical protein